MDRSTEIFRNPMPAKVIRKAVAQKAKFQKRFGEDSDTEYHLGIKENTIIGDPLGVSELKLSNETTAVFDKKSFVVGTIRMGYGHYRIAMAIASAAHALGYQPLWFDLHAFQQTTCGKVIAYQNGLYSMGSRWSQKYPLFNKLYWEPLNSEGFRQLSYNAIDQKVAELMIPVFHDLPRDIPFVATHVWPAQAAVHAGLGHVVNAIPDNWPMALHLAEGSLHTVQTPSARLGYEALRGMDKTRQLHPMPANEIFNVGHYIDHEIVHNISFDCDLRRTRCRLKQPRRYLLTIGGAGAQQEIFACVIETLLPSVVHGEAALFINIGDHRDVWEAMLKRVPALANSTLHFNDYSSAAAFASDMLTSSVNGIHVFYDANIFSAVYTTNLLIRTCDFLVTKPSELSFYPVPKLMIPRVGGHEAWGAIRAAEVGDGTYECRTISEIKALVLLLQSDDEILLSMCDAIETANKNCLYNGAYRVVELAVSR